MNFSLESDTMEMKCLDLANQLIIYSNISHPRLNHLKDINSEFLILLFEKVTKHNVTDLLLSASREDDVHNIQAVIDTLSLDLLGISLSHITGEAIVAGNCFAIHNLLEILEGILLHVPSEINKEHSQSQTLKRKLCKLKRSVNSPETLNGPELTSSKNRKVRNRNNITQRKESITTLSSNSTLDSKIAALVSSQIPSCSYSGKDQPDTSYEESKISEAIIVEENALRKRSALGKTGSKSNIKERKSSRSSSRTVTLQKPAFFKAKCSQSRKSARSETLNRKISTLSKGTSCNIDPRTYSKLSCKRENSSNVFSSKGIEDVMEDNMEHRIRLILEKNNLHKSRASDMRKIHLRTIRNSNGRKHVSPCKKSFLLPSTLRQRSKSYSTLKKTPALSCKDQTSQVLKQRSAIKEHSKKGFIQELMREFSGLQHSTAILNHISKKYRQHLMALHKQIQNSITSKPKSQLKAEEIAKRQIVISNLLKKDVLQEKHLQELQDQKLSGNKIKYHLRDARLQSARMKQYRDEFQSEMKKKVQRRDLAEEKALEDVFKDVLNKQKEQVNLLCQEVKETGENDARQHLTYLDALENLYQSQYSMISEALVSEKKESQERMQAEKQEMRLRRRDFEKELKKEIRFMQEVILDSTENSRLREFQV